MVAGRLAGWPLMYRGLTLTGTPQSHATRGPDTSHGLDALGIGEEELHELRIGSQQVEQVRSHRLDDALLGLVVHVWG